MNAKNIAKKIVLAISSIRLIPHILFMKFHPSKEIIKLDIERWSRENNMSKAPSSTWSHIYVFLKLMTYHESLSYRNLFYYRLGWISRILYPLCRPMPLLDISLVNEGIGPGFVINHGRASSVAAKKIGKNCTIFQHVTIGYVNEKNGKPELGDNVTLYAGAKVLGNVKVGDNSIVGANAVIVKNVPANCTVVGVYPAYIVRRNGEKVSEPL